MTCAEFETHLSAYVDGELSRWTRWKVHNHLHECAGCATCLRELEAVDEVVLASVQSVPDPEYVTGAVMHRLPAMPPAWRRRGGALPWAAGIAVAGLQAVALYGVYHWGYTQGTGVPPGRGGTVESSAPVNRTETADGAIQAPVQAPVQPRGNMAGGFLTRPRPVSTPARPDAALVSDAPASRVEQPRPRFPRLPSPGPSGSFAAPFPSRSLQLNGARP